MCGIIGYIGTRKSVPILIAGLERLAYRGYDSSGIACLDRQTSKINLLKEKGKLSCLKAKLADFPKNGAVGIGHTRWATHGEPSAINAHPHLDCSGKFAIVHNGIIENYQELKKELWEKGHKFVSETDTEVFAHLIEENYKTNLYQAFRQSLKRLVGFFAFVMVSFYEPDKLFVFKRSNPLVIGIGNQENFVASDVPAILPYTRKVIYLADEEIGIFGRDYVRISSLTNPRPIKKKVSQVKWSMGQAQKGGYAHFMLKEIYEQPEVIQTTLQKRICQRKVFFDTISTRVKKRLKKIKRIFIVSCGTAYHAGIAGKYMIEEQARISTFVHVSSEFRYADPILNQDDIVILITQSGETADTLAALREAKAKSAFTLAIVNVVGSTIAREADCVIYTHAGPEIGVASTKAYTAQLSTLVLFAIYLARLRGVLSRKEEEKLLKEARHLPSAVEKILKDIQAIEDCAQTLYRKRDFIYLARGYSLANALEGALKLKEITYSHAHGYPAGEMKHGPIALIDKSQPVICLIPPSKTYDKMLGNIEEIKARDGIVIAVAAEGDKKIKRLSNFIFFVPQTIEFFSPILTVIPLQLLAYKIAVLNGRDVDQPRNLAKSVTVE